MAQASSVERLLTSTERSKYSTEELEYANRVNENRIAVGEKPFEANQIIDMLETRATSTNGGTRTPNFTNTAPKPLEKRDYDTGEYVELSNVSLTPRQQVKVDSLDKGNDLTINGTKFDSEHLLYDEDTGELKGISGNLANALASSRTNGLSLRQQLYQGELITPNQQRINNMLSNETTETVDAIAEINGRRRANGMRDLLPSEITEELARINPRQPSVNEQALQSTYDDLVRQVRRIERTPVSQRTEAQLAELTSLRANRLQAQRAVEQASNTKSAPTKFFNSFLVGKYKAY